MVILLMYYSTTMALASEARSPMIFGSWFLPRCLRGFMCLAFAHVVGASMEKTFVDRKWAVFGCGGLIGLDSMVISCKLQHSSLEISYLPIWSLV
jgi:hypothetical protein